MHALILLSICANSRALSESAKIKRQYVSPGGPYYIRNNNNDANAQTIRQVDQKDANGNYNYEYECKNARPLISFPLTHFSPATISLIRRYETTNGIKVKQTSYMNGAERIVVGFYSYPINGEIYTVNYISDRNGYRATGTQLGGPGQLPTIPSSISSSSLPSFPTYGSSTPLPPGQSVIPLQPLQPGYVSTTPSSLIIPSAPYSPTQSPYSPTQTIYTPSSTYYPSTTPAYYPSSTPYPYSPYQSSTGRPFVPSSTFVPSTTALPQFPVYTGTTVPFPGYVYQPQGPYNNGPSSPGYSTPVTSFNYGSTPSSYLLSSTAAGATAYTTPVASIAYPSSTPAPVRGYQPSYGLANNFNAPAITASTPRPFAVSSTTPSPFSGQDQNVVYITPSPKLYANPSVQPLGRDIPSSINGIDNNLYRNNYAFQNVRPLASSTPFPPSAGDTSITNFNYRNGNAY